jgi:hypothetical protein
MREELLPVTLLLASQGCTAMFDKNYLLFSPISFSKYNSLGQNSLSYAWLIYIAKNLHQIRFLHARGFMGRIMYIASFSSRPLPPPSSFPSSSP